MTIFYDFGDSVVQQATFRNTLTGVITDPTTVTGSYQKPSGAEVLVTYPDPQLTKSAVGVYELVINVDEDVTGEWFWRIAGSGDIQAATEGSFKVLKTFTNPPQETISSDDIVAAAKSPKEVTTDEGTVKERSVQETIAAANFNANQNVTDDPLHGLRVSRAIPGGAV